MREELEKRRRFRGRVTVAGCFLVLFGAALFMGIPLFVTAWRYWVAS